MSSSELSPEQIRALFDILTHHEAYSEITDFRFPETVARYGHPFRPGGDDVRQDTEAGKSGSPLLQLLFTRLVLTMPGVSSLPDDFWSVRVQGLLSKLAEAGLSESYDKGALGTRKTLATAASAIIEAVARGVLGGYPEKLGPAPREGVEADKDALRLVHAFDRNVRDLIHGSLIDETFDWMKEHDNLEDHSENMKGAVDYCILQWVSRCWDHPVVHALAVI
jgi:hypothetical protein